MQPFLLNMLVNRLAFSAFELRPDEQIVNSEITRKLFAMSRIEFLPLQYSKNGNCGQFKFPHFPSYDSLA